MSDDLRKKGLQDDARINLSQDHEVDYWTRKFKVSKEELSEAVEHVGTGAKEVADYLSERGK